MWPVSPMAGNEKANAIPAEEIWGKATPMKISRRRTRYTPISGQAKPTSRLTYTELRNRKCGSRISRSVSMSVNFQFHDLLDFFPAEQLFDRPMKNVALMKPDYFLCRVADRR